jgi:hypothetical protein
LESNSNQVWNLADDNPSTREDFLKEVIRLKGIKKYKIMKYSQHSLKLSEKAKKFWLNNKKVSNQKVKKFFKYRFIFPSFKSGLKNLKEYL